MARPSMRVIMALSEMAQRMTQRQFKLLSMLLALELIVNPYQFGQLETLIPE